MSNDAKILLLWSIGMFIVWLTTYIHYRRKYIALKKQFNLELTIETDRAWLDGFKDGWSALAGSPITVKEICNEYFKTHHP